MIARRLPGWLLAAGLVLAAGPAVAETQGHEQRVERLTDAMVVLMPFGTIFDSIAADEPTWPAMGRADEITGKQLACLRGELSSKGYRRHVRERVKAYADANRERIANDITLVENGVAEMFGRLVIAGAEGERTGVQADPDAILAEYSEAQGNAFMAFFESEEYAGLRELAGLGDQLGRGKTAQENEAAGEQLGSALATELLIRAMDTCDVDLP